MRFILWQNRSIYYKDTVFPSISTPGTYLMRCLKEGGIYFKVGGSIPMKLQNFVTFTFQIIINNHYCDK